MSMQNLLTPVVRWVRTALKVQFLTTALSLPVLIGWGLPLSMMSIVGNIAATPFLLATLFMSSLLFITELLHIPNQLLCTGTNHLISAWHFLLKQGNSEWLIGAPAPHPTVSILLCALVAMGIWVCVSRFKISLVIASIGASLLCVVLGILLSHTTTHDVEKLTCYKRNEQTIVADHHFFAQKPQPLQAVRYTVKPLLLKKFGSLRVDIWRTSHAGIRTLRGLREALNEIKIASIHITQTPPQKNAAWALAWRDLQEKAHEKNATITLLAKSPTQTLKQL